MKGNLIVLFDRKEKSRLRYGMPDRNANVFGFRCVHCNGFVTLDPGFSGVQNRNHCPYCLWSRHLDLYGAGDRLSACKAAMEPIGLTIKITRNKYGPGRGELMLVHACKACGAFSINRIAADDDPRTIFAVYESSIQMAGTFQERLDADGIHLLGKDDNSQIRLQLFGDDTRLLRMHPIDSLIRAG